MQQAGEGYPPHPLCPNEATSEVLCPALNSPLQDKELLEKLISVTVASLSGKKAARAGLVLLEEETTEWIVSILRYILRMSIKKVRPDSFHDTPAQWQDKGQEA